MTSRKKLVIAAFLALLVLPATPAYADNHRDCDVHDEDDDCKREKPRFQTKFFSE